MPSDTKITEQIHKYICDNLEEEPPFLKDLHAETNRLPEAEMQISWEQAQFMTVILKAIHAKKTIEIGVFTGYSALITALALPDEGTVIACDINEKWTSFGKKYWEIAGVLNKIDLRIAPAIETLERLLVDGESETFDFAFIDADKSNDLVYYEKCLQLIKPGGLIMVDNALWGGAVLGEESNDKDTLAIQQFNKTVARDERVHSYLAPIRDGIQLIFKK